MKTRGLRTVYGSLDALLVDREVEIVHIAVFKSDAPNHIAEGVNKGGYTISFYGPDGITLELLQPPP